MQFDRLRYTALAFLFIFSLFINVSHALDIIIEPQQAQRAINGYVRVHIYATDAIDLISFGVKVTFDPAILEVVDVQKYTTFSATASGWIMDADGDYNTTGDRYATPASVIDPNGSVTMIGGRLIGSNTSGLSGKVLLGWIRFKALTNGNSNLLVDVAKPNPFDNFVRLSGIVDDDSITKGSKAIICVVVDPCEADVDGNNVVNATDNLLFRNAFPSAFGDSKYKPQFDLNGDGAVNATDRLIFRPDFPRSCASCRP